MDLGFKSTVMTDKLNLTMKMIRISKSSLLKVEVSRKQSTHEVLRIEMTLDFSGIST